MNNLPIIVDKIEEIKKLKHPNLLEYISVWTKENKNKAVIITELLQGGNLNEHRKYQKKLKIKLIKKWIKQILSALDFLHSNGFIHHDIKCQNILVDRISGNLKIGDLLGVEKLGEKEYFTKYIGTEEFMAPEVKEGKYTFKADIYSLGLTIIQFLTLEKPYKEFQRKKNLYEAKKKGILPLAFDEINNNEIKKFILLCLKVESQRPTCKELLKNEWLNDNHSPDHNKVVEIINNLRQENFMVNKKAVSFNYKHSQVLSPFASSNSLYNQEIDKKPSNSPIYSLDISKLNPGKNFKGKKGKITNSINFFQYNKNINEPPNKCKKVFSMGSLSALDNNCKENKHVSSDRTNKKLKSKFENNFKFFKEIDSTEIIRYEEQNKLIIIYLYIKESEDKLFFIIKDEKEENEGNLFNLKIITSNKKWKKIPLIENKIYLEYTYNGEKKNLEIIVEYLQKLIELTKNDILLIKKKLNGAISKIIKEKKIRDLQEKISMVIKDFEFLINNTEFEELECLINSKDFEENKLPKDIINKIKYYKDTKANIEILFSLNNLNSNIDNKYNYNLICQEYVILNLFDID